MRAASVRAAYTSGEWHVRSPSVVGISAAVLAVADLLTTAYVLSAHAYVEFNLALAHLAAVHEALAIGVHAVYLLALVLLAWLSIGWPSTVAGWFVLGVSGPAALNNLLLLGGGMELVSVVPLSPAVLVHLVLPTVGVGAGVLVAYRRYGGLPLREVVVVAAVLLGVTIAPWVVG